MNSIVKLHNDHRFKCMVTMCMFIDMNYSISTCQQHRFPVLLVVSYHECCLRYQHHFSRLNILLMMKFI